jgi:hypothetical protein
MPDGITLVCSLYDCPAVKQAVNSINPIGYVEPTTGTQALSGENS